MNRFDGVLVNADATKMYGELGGGANKVLLKNAGVRLWDVASATKSGSEFSAGQFHDVAVVEIHKIIEEEHKMPIIVGGSGLYMRWLLRGKQAGPPRDQTRSKEILTEIRSLPWNEVKARVEAVDPVYGAKIGANDYRRAARALELHERTGQLVTDLQRQRTTALHDLSSDSSSQEIELDSNHDLKLSHWQDLVDFRPFVLLQPRVQLYDVICRRCENMILDGLFLEVWALMRQGLTADSTAGKAIGYRQTIDYLNSRIFTEETFMHFLIDFQSKTRQLAHRQLAWFRKEPDFLPIDLDENTADLIEKYVLLPQEDWLELVRNQQSPTDEQIHNEAVALRNYQPPTGLFILPHVTRKTRTPAYDKMVQYRSEMIQRQLMVLDHILFEMDRIGFSSPSKSHS